MAVSAFAAIEIGSYALEMKIYEISTKGNIKEIDRIFHVIELGRQSYSNKKINFELIDEVCDILYDFCNIMKGYGIKDYRICATSAVREADNCQNIVDRIHIRTGMQVDVLSNSELRFVYNKALALKEKKFNQIVSEGTLLIDVGSGSVQITIFDGGKLITTQNVKLGAMRVREVLSRLKIKSADYMSILEEYVDNDIRDLIAMFFGDVKIKNMIACGDYVAHIMAEADEEVRDKEILTNGEFFQQYENIIRNAMINSDEYIGGTKIPTEILIPSVVIYKKILDISKAHTIWIPRTNLCDGMVAEYAQNNKKLKVNRNFQDDILNAAWVISRRYQCSEEHLKMVKKSALMVFDEMKKYHGLSERERLLLQIAVILHDNGKYVSIQDPGMGCYNIIAGTEIIGLSHLERMMVANIARYNMDEFDYEAVRQQGFNQEKSMIIQKLTAILRICNALDRTHKQKCKDLSVSLDERELVITTKTFENIAIEKGMFEDKAVMFEELYGIKPVLKVKRG